MNYEIRPVKDDQWIEQLQAAMPEWDRSVPPRPLTEEAAVWVVARAAHLAPMASSGPLDGEPLIQPQHIAQAFREAHARGMFASLSAAVSFYAWITVQAIRKSGGDARQ